MQNSSNDQISKIIDMESRRLDQKRQSVDFIRSGQKRMMLMNDSYRKRYMQYIKIIIIIIIVLALFGFFQYASSTFTSIPSALFDILSIIVISVGIIYAYLIYADIGLHNRINYDEIDYVAPVIPDKSKMVTSASVSSVTPSVNTDLFNLKNLGCINSNCCSEGTVWNDNTSVCVTKPSGFIPVTTPSSFSQVTKPSSSFSQVTTPSKFN